MKQIIPVNAFRCRMWALHDRLETQITEDSCRDEIESFRKQGQLLPVLGRAIRGEPDFDVELIYGARRLFVARHLNQPLLVEVTDISDRDAVVAMDIENRQRRDISPYERGMGYACCLRRGLFSSQEDLAHAMRVSASQVSRLLKFARIPSAVVSAFDSPVDICECWAADLVNILDEPNRRQSLLNRAREIGRLPSRPTASDIYSQLVAAAAGQSRRSKTRDEVIRDEQGNPLFKIRHRTNSITVLLPKLQTTTARIEHIRDAIIEILQHASWQSIESKSKTIRNPRGSISAQRGLDADAA